MTCYEVQVIAGCEIVDSHTGGNDPYDSTISVTENPYSLEQMLEFARKTALEMAPEHNLAESAVGHDPDIDTNLKEEHEQAEIVK